jgi:hypothetical protein
MLKLRRFVLGMDEANWLRVWNAVYGVRWDMAPMTVDEMTAMEKSPDFDSEGRFIAELDDQPVGIVARARVRVFFSVQVCCVFGPTFSHL